MSSPGNRLPGREMSGRLVKAIGLALLLLLPDQLTKYLAWAKLRTGGPVSIIPGILELHYLENRGAAFGMLQSLQGVFVVFAAVIAAACVWSCLRLPEGKRTLPLRLAAMFLAAGAAGNMIDRLAHRYVIDFIYVSAIHFPVFNMADIYVVLSTAALLILLLFVYPEEALAGWRRR